MPSYLVTGGCGFIGSHLADALVSLGHQVTILDNLSTGKLSNATSNARVVVGDICDTALVRDLIKEVDGCFHLAAIASVEKSKEDWTRTHQVNVTGTVTLFDAIHHRPQGIIPMIYASSAAVYGDNPHIPLTETEGGSPINAYGADKYSSELHAHIAFGIHGIPNLGCRFFNVYGPRQDPSSPYSGVISIFVNRILSGEDITIFGDGEQIRDFVYVSDIVDTLVIGMQALHKDVSGAHVINVCTGIPISLNILAETIEQIAHKHVKHHFKPPRLGDIRISLGDPSRCRKLLQTSPSIPLQIGLTRYITSQSTSKLRGGVA